MEKRTRPDRRTTPTPLLSRHTFFRGRRKAFRRREDRQRGGFVDRYSPWLFAVLVWIAALNILDALFTHLILERGGTELNPVAAWAIAAFGNHFVVWKLSVICVSLLILCLLSKHRFARVVIATSAALYSGVVCYQLVLLSNVM